MTELEKSDLEETENKIKEVDAKLESVAKNINELKLQQEQQPQNGHVAENITQLTEQQNKLQGEKIKLLYAKILYLKQAAELNKDNSTRKFDISTYNASFVKSKHASLFRFDESCMWLRTFLGARPVFDYVCELTDLEEIIQKFDDDSGSEKWTNDDERFCTTFKKWDDENGDTPMALSFLKSKLELKSSNIQFVSVQQNGQYQYDIGTALVKTACRLDGLVWLDDRKESVGDTSQQTLSDSTLNNVVLGVEFCTSRNSSNKLKSGQIIVELICLNVCSNRPALLLCTDLRDTFTLIYLIHDAYAGEYKLRTLLKVPPSLAFRFVSSWVNKDPDQFPEGILSACNKVKQCNKEILGQVAETDVVTPMKNMQLNESENGLTIDIKQRLKKKFQLGDIDEAIERTFSSSPRHLLGRGRSGGVFMVRVNQQEIALKICNFKNDSVVRELVNEIRTYQFLVLNNFEFCLRPVSFGFFRDKNYLALALPLFGKSLDKQTREDWIMEKCFGAFKKLHQLGIYHNDVRAQNILVSHDQINIIDFGFSEKRQPSTEVPNFFNHFFNTDIKNLCLIFELSKSSTYWPSLRVISDKKVCKAENKVKDSVQSSPPSANTRSHKS